MIDMRRHLKILNVSQNHYVRGGSDRYFLELGGLLSSRGHEVIPFCSRSDRDLPTPWRRYFPVGADFEHPGVKDVFRYLFSMPARKNIRALLKAARPDLAHLHIYYGKLTASILQPLHALGLPVIQTLHEYKQLCPVYTLISRGRLCEACDGSKYYRCLLNRCNRGSLARSGLSCAEAYLSRWLGCRSKIDHFLAVSDFQRRKHIDLGVAEEKISTLHNFVDTESYRVGSGEGEYFLYYGRLERLKGIYTLLEAARSVPVPLIFVGHGSELSSLRQRIDDMGLSHVSLAGFHSGDELKALIRKSICTILPSEWYEPFGLTVIESFASGVPAIASRIGGIAELISPGVDGFLVEPGDSEELAEKMLWMASHRREAREMGLRGRAKAEASFSPEAHYQRLVGIYHRVLGGK